MTDGDRTPEDVSPLARMAQGYREIEEKAAEEIERRGVTDRRQARAIRREVQEGNSG